MPEKITGSCHCGAVRYSVTGEIKTAANCHCNTCKKLTGAAFNTLAFTARGNLRIDTGEAELTSYRVSDNATKYFCRTCGTPIYSLHRAFPDSCMVPIGSLDAPAATAPAVNVFCESMLPWVKEITSLPSFDKEPPRR